MGCGLPYAIGSCIANDRNPVFCITGDGGLQMNIQEFQTLASEKLPIKVFVINNKSLGKILEIQDGTYDNRRLITSEDSGYTVPDFEKVANAYGIKSKTFIGYEHLGEVSDWLGDEEPCLINILIPEATVLQPKMNWNDKEMKPLLSDDIMNKARMILE